MAPLEELRQQDDEEGYPERDAEGELSRTQQRSMDVRHFAIGMPRDQCCSRIDRAGVRRANEEGEEAAPDLQERQGERDECDEYDEHGENAPRSAGPAGEPGTTCPGSIAGHLLRAPLHR